MSTRIGPMVATLIRARNETITSVAAMTGIHRNRLADKIAGRRAFTEPEIIALASHFDIPPGRLFDDPLELLGVSPSVPESARGLVRSTFSEPRRSAAKRYTPLTFHRSTCDLDSRAA